MASARQGKLRFHRKALKEWKRLDASVRGYFKKKLAKLLDEREAPGAANALAGDLAGCYKIKHQSSGYRLIYRYGADKKVIDVLVLAVGKRERGVVYRKTKGRLAR